MAVKRRARREAVSDYKRKLILDAARRVFVREGLEGASLRAIAVEAGYTPAALYFHFDSKEALYAEVLRASLDALGTAVEAAVGEAGSPEQKLEAAAMAFFRFYAENPRDLDLGFYLFRGGMKRAGLGHARDLALNAALDAALRPIAVAAVELGASPARANRLMVECFAHAAGLLLLLHTGRIRMFGTDAADMMESFVKNGLAQLTENGAC